MLAAAAFLAALVAYGLGADSASEAADAAGLVLVTTSALLMTPQLVSNRYLGKVDKWWERSRLPDIQQGVASSVLFVLTWVMKLAWVIAGVAAVMATAILTRQLNVGGLSLLPVLGAEASSLDALFPFVFAAAVFALMVAALAALIRQAFYRGPERKREKLTANLLFSALHSPELRDRTFTVAAGLFILGTILQLYAAVGS